MKTDSTLTADRLREVLDYDGGTGVFRWKVDIGQRASVGRVAGTQNRRGYRCIKIDGVAHQSHRLAWLHVYGEWPADQVDHRNEDKSDNRIANLREATNGQNQQNGSRPYSNNTSGHRGVSLHSASGRWRADIRVGGRTHFLGLFSTPEEAHAAYLAAKVELHPFAST